MQRRAAANTLLSWLPMAGKGGNFLLPGKTGHSHMDTVHPKPFQPSMPQAQCHNRPSLYACTAPHHALATGSHQHYMLHPECSVHLLIHSLTKQQERSSATDSFTNPMTRPSTHSRISTSYSSSMPHFTRSHTHSLACSLTHSLPRSVPHPQSFSLTSTNASSSMQFFTARRPSLTASLI